MRVVKHAPAQTPQRRRGDRVTIDGAAETVRNARQVPGDAAAQARVAGLPLLPIFLFLFACMGGGILVALLRPFGIG